jgi:hypothetical protein
MHERAAELGMYDPAAHGSHGFCPETEKLPGSQSLTADVSECVPSVSACVLPPMLCLCCKLSLPAPSACVAGVSSFFSLGFPLPPTPFGCDNTCREPKYVTHSFIRSTDGRAYTHTPCEAFSRMAWAAAEMFKTDLLVKGNIDVHTLLVAHSAVALFVALLGHDHRLARAPQNALKVQRVA